MISCFLTLYFSGAVPQQHEGTSNPTENRQQDVDATWKAMLVGLSKELHISIAFDIPPGPAPDQTITAPSEFILDLLAQKTLRTKALVDGVYTFVRRQPDAFGGLNTSSQRFVRALCSLDQDSLRSLCTKGLETTELPPAVLKEMLLALPMSPDATLRVARGEPMKLALDVNAQYSFLDPNSKSVRTGQLYASRYGGWIQDALLAKQPNVKPDLLPGFDGTIQPSPSDGPLDFGSGQLLSLEEAVQKAKDAFGANLYFDRRMIDTRCFFSGRYSKKRFFNIVSLLMRTVPLTEVNSFVDDPSLIKLFTDLRSVFHDDAATRQSVFGRIAMAQSNMSSGDLAASSTLFADVLRQYGIGTAHFSVDLTPILALSVFMPESDEGGQIAFRLDLGRLGG